MEPLQTTGSSPRIAIFSDGPSHAVILGRVAYFNRNTSTQRACSLQADAPLAGILVVLIFEVVVSSLLAWNCLALLHVITEGRLLRRVVGQFYKV